MKKTYAEQIKAYYNRTLPTYELIKSVYGKTSLEEYLFKNIESKQLHIIDNKKAEKLSRVLGLQLPTTLISSSRKFNISPRLEDVNNHFQKESVRNKLQHYQRQQREYQSEHKNLSITDRDRER